MPGVCSRSYRFLWKYLDWVYFTLCVEGKKSLARDQKNGSNFITQLLNMIMGEISLKEFRGKASYFNFNQDITLD